MLKLLKSKLHPSPSTAISLVALVVALGGAGYAANGGTFILGDNNSATQRTYLSAPYDGAALQVANIADKPSATALTLSVAAGHPPMRVNSTTKVANLNSDWLDGLDSMAFGRLIAMSSVGFDGAPLALGNNYYFAPAFSPSAAGRCQVTVDVQLENPSGVTRPDYGPSLWVAIKRGTDAPVTDQLGGEEHNFEQFSTKVSSVLTEVGTFNVKADEATQLGVLFFSPPQTWVGMPPSIHLSYTCMTTGTLKSASASAATIDAAGLERNRNARSFP